MQTAAANKGMKTKTKTCYDGTMPGSVNIEGQKIRLAIFIFLNQGLTLMRSDSDL